MDTSNYLQNRLFIKYPKHIVALKKHRQKIDKMLNIFESLAVEPVFLYLVRNIANLIFIIFGKGFLLAIWISISMLVFELHKQTRFCLQNLILLKE